MGNEKLPRPESDRVKKLLEVVGTIDKIWSRS